jgi:hypothetical protein
MLAAGQNRGRAPGDTRQNVAKRTIQRNNRLSPVPALAGGEHDGFFANMGPGQANQVAEPQAGIGGQIDSVADFGGAGDLDVVDIGLGPDDLGPVVLVEVLDSFAWVAGDPT